MNRFRDLLTNYLGRRIRTSHALRGFRRRVESRIPLAAPVLTHILDRPFDQAARNVRNGNGRLRRPLRAPRKHPLAMTLGFTIPIGNGRQNSSRLQIRTLFRLER